MRPRAPVIQRRGITRRVSAVVGVGILLAVLLTLGLFLQRDSWNLGVLWRGVAEREAEGAVPLSLPGGLKQQGRTVSARAAVVIDGASGNVLFEQAAFEPQPIASLAKLMSAMVVLDRNPDLDALVTVLPTEYTLRGGNLRLTYGESVTLRDLLFASITGSANNAALALPRVVGLSEEEFVREMNRKAVALGLDSLRFADPAGFSPDNVGTAYDVARMAAAAFARYPLIAAAASVPEYRIVARTSALSSRDHVIRNSNQLFGELPEGTASKTGYLDEALFCLTLARQQGGKHLVAVLLGHPSEFDVVREAAALLGTATADGVGLSVGASLR